MEQEEKGMKRKYVDVTESGSVCGNEMNERSQDDNVGFMFIKPHANTPETQSLVTSVLTENGVKILSEGEMTAEQIAMGMHIDKHYYALASKATLLKPTDLSVPVQQFEDFYGVSWKSAVDDGLVFNALDACEYLGIDAEGLEKYWRICEQNEKQVKFGGGFYCGLICVEGKRPVYVFNGFFMKMRAKYVTPGTSIHYYTVSFCSSSLSWHSFRHDVVGPTDPSKASSTSLRGKIFAEWESLGLEFQPHIGNNSVHASASPFESLVERMNWLNLNLKDDDFAAKLLAKGITEETIKKWSLDPKVNGSSLFDQFEDKDCDHILDVAAHIMDCT